MDIKLKVAEKIASSGGIVLDSVVERLAEVEIQKRISAIQLAVSKLDSLNKEFAKINGKCDSVHYDKDGIKVESMSEKRFNEIKKTKESIDSLSKAIDSALETNTEESYKKLNGLLGVNSKEASGEVKSEA